MFLEIVSERGMGGCKRDTNTAWSLGSRVQDFGCNFRVRGRDWNDQVNLMHQSLRSL